MAKKRTDPAALAPDHLGGPTLNSMLRTFAAVCLLLVPAAMARSSEPPVLRVSTILMPPFVDLGPDGQLTGKAVAAVRSIAGRCNIAADFIVAPSWLRAFSAARDGITDAAMPTNRSDERARHFDFPATPIVELKPALFVLASGPYGRFTGLDMLAGKGVGVRKGAILDGDFDTYVRSGKVRLAERGDTEALLDDLLTGRVDFIGSPPDMVMHKLKELGFEAHVRQLDPPLGVSIQYLALSKKRTAVFASDTALSACLMSAVP